MEFIKQTKFKEEGNCLEACIASLTGIALENFPDLSEVEADDGRFWGVLNQYLRESHNIYVESVKFEDYNNHYERGLIIAIGQSQISNDMLHAVLWDFEKQRMIFDPYPSNCGIVGEPVSYGIIVNHYMDDKK
jgi:hypothetical protein